MKIKSHQCIMKHMISHVKANCYDRNAQSNYMYINSEVEGKVDHRTEESYNIIAQIMSWTGKAYKGKILNSSAPKCSGYLRPS